MDGDHQAAGAVSAAVGTGGAGFRHAALLAGSQEQYQAGVTGFVRAALDRDEPVLVAVPAFRAGPLRQRLGAAAGQATWAGMDPVGRNPARIIPALSAFARDSVRSRVSSVGACGWRGRTGPGPAEAF